MSYLYDGDGRKVKDSGGASGTRVYVYDTAGRVIEEMDQNGSVINEYFYLGNERMGRVYQLSFNYQYYNDYLGTPRVITENGYSTCYDADYFPWGHEQHVYVNTCSQNYKFTGKERDPDMGVDYFGARFYQGNMSRFYSPDPGNASAVPEDPQSWNGYSYVGNNPSTRTDPDGENYQVCDSKGNNCADLTDQQYEDYREQNQNQTVTASGDIYQINPNGSTTKVGHETYYNEKDVQAAQMLVRTGATLSDPRTIAGFYGAPALLGAGFYAAGLTSGAELSSILTENLEGVLSRASSAVGNQGAKVASREVAEQAAKEWVGEGARPITGNYARQAGGQLGWESADGTRVARFNNADTKGYINLVNKITGGNLHVGW